MANFPRMYRLKQHFANPVVEDVPATVQRELAALKLDEAVSPGRKIGITVGSRGIRNLLPILEGCAEHLRRLGAEPYFIAAMGSHGGGREQGQREVLESLGINEKNLGAPVVACDRCRVIAQTPGGLPVYCLESALEPDGILVVNRVKTHTSFKAVVESGLVKMMVVGLGGPSGATQFHGFGWAELPRLLPEIGRTVLNTLPILGGLAIVENAYEETALVRAVPREGMVEREAELLAYSKTLMPALPVGEIDFLIIGEMGKNFSGTGIDTNIIGRIRIQGVPEPETPFVKRIAVLDLSDASHGNAHGIGLADFTTRRLVDKMDRRVTYRNSLTSTFVVRSAIPMYFDTDEQLVDAALASLSGIPVEKLRIVVIPNTLFLNECLVSESIAEELRKKPGPNLEPAPEEPAFDGDRNLVLPFYTPHQNYL